MIISIFLTLFLLMLLLVVIGLWADKPYLLGVGYVFLFIIGLIIAGIGNPVISTGIDYPTGSTINAATLSAIVISDTYTTFSNLTLGFFFAIVSIFAFVLLLMQYRPEE